MDTLFRSIQTLQQRLNEAGIPSVVIGGVAVGTWGNPRVTRDVGLKVLLGRQDADRLLTLLSPDYVSLLPDPPSGSSAAGPAVCGRSGRRAV
jgi:hypothetical protein